MARTLHMKWVLQSFKSSTDMLDIHISSAKDLEPGLLTLEIIDEPSADRPAQPLRILDRFEAQLSKVDRAWKLAIIDNRDALHPARNGQYLLMDHVGLRFSEQEKYTIVLLDSAENKQVCSKLYRLGVRVKDGNGEVATHLTPCPVAGLNAGRCHALAMMASAGASVLSLHTRYTAVIDVLPDSDRLVRERVRELEKKRLEEYLQWAASYQEYLKELTKYADTPYKAYYQDVERYRSLVSDTLDLTDRLKKFGPGDEWHGSTLEVLAKKRKQMEAIEKDALQYIDIAQGIPARYRTEAITSQKRRERCAKVDEFADSPLCLFMCCLPLGGLLESGLALMKDDYSGALVAAALTVVTYGSFGQIGSVGRLYKQLKKAEKPVLGELFEGRLMHVMQHVDLKTLAGWASLADLSKQLSPYATKFFNCVSALKDFKDALLDLGSLFANRNAFAKSLKFATKPGYKDWLKDSKKISGALLAWGGLRALALAAKATDEIRNLSDEMQGKAIKNVLLQELPKLRELMPAEDGSWLTDTLLSSLENIEPAFFADEDHGLLCLNYAGQYLHREWEADARAKASRPNARRRTPSTLHESEELRKNLRTLRQTWENQEAALKKWCGGDRNPTNSQDRMAYARVRLGLFNGLELENQVGRFLEMLQGVLSVALPSVSPDAFLLPAFLAHPVDVMGTKMYIELPFDAFECASLSILEEIDG